jgi:monoamine oxidase
VGVRRSLDRQSDEVVVQGGDVDVVVVGGGAAGIAAARRLRQAAVNCLLVEARQRLGGRAWTVTDPTGVALDLGCGWLHSADRNPWVAIAREQGVVVDKSQPPWTRRTLEIGFPPAQQSEFQEAIGAFYTRLERVRDRDADIAAGIYLDPHSRWNGLINALGSYITGAEWDRVSAIDFGRYDSTDVNWRVAKGYGALISDCGANLPAVLGCLVRAIDHRGRRLRIETASGAISADQVVVTVPTTLLAAERIAFTPALPQKTQAAQGLPLGLNNKLFLSLADADEFDNDVRVFGHTDRAATAAYQLRPLGRPVIEAYFGGKFAAELEAGDDGGFFDFAVSELVGLFGSAFAGRVKPIGLHRWGHDPLSLGSYSYARPGFADCRLALAEPVDGRLFFAGEACSVHDFSTAHGGWQTGVHAAEQVIAARNKAELRGRR